MTTTQRSEDERLDRPRHTGLVVGRGHRPAARLQLVERVPHQTGVPANSSICRSLRLSPIAMTSSPAIARGARPTRAAPSPSSSRRGRRRRARSRDAGTRSARPRNPARPDRQPRCAAVRTASRISAQPPGEHHLDRVLGQRVLERLISARKRPVGVEEAAMPGMFPVDRFEHDLALARAIEDDAPRCRDASGARASTSRAISRGSSCRISVSPSSRLHDRAVAEDERQRRGQLLEDRPREVVAAPGRQRDLDAGLDRPARSPRDWPSGTARDCRGSCRRCRGRAGGSFGGAWHDTADRTAPLTPPAFARLRPSVLRLQPPDPPQNCTRSSPTTWRFVMSPNTCCCTS